MPVTYIRALVALMQTTIFKTVISFVGGFGGKLHYFLVSLTHCWKPIQKKQNQRLKFLYAGQYLKTSIFNRFWSHKGGGPRSMK